jgi:hypothetical protein
MADGLSRIGGSSAESQTAARGYISFKGKEIRTMMIA